MKTNLWVVVVDGEQVGNEQGFRAAVEFCDALRASNPGQRFTVEPVFEAEVVEEPVLAEVDE
jgi:hypothetical protein